MSFWRLFVVAVFMQVCTFQLARAADEPVKSALADFFSYYDSQLKQIKDLPTAVKQEEFERTLPKKLDDMLRSQTWELHCQIREVKDVGKNHFKISHGPPDELGNEKKWGYRNSSTLFLSRQDALSLQPGDYIIYSGTPRFSTGHESADTDFFSRYYARKSTATYHAVHLTGMKVKIQRASDSKEESVELAH